MLLNEEIIQGDSTIMGRIFMLSVSSVLGIFEMVWNFWSPVGEVVERRNPVERPKRLTFGRADTFVSGFHRRRTSSLENGLKKGKDAWRVHGRP
jgi:hypothetical protein